MNINREPSYLVGLIGSGIQASLSPVMHEREGARHGLQYMYRLLDLDVLGLDVAALPRLLDAAELTGFCGLNLTHPCKQAVIPLLGELSEDARAIGAVNAVVFRDGKRLGYNTDCWGFEQGLREELGSARLENVVLLGAGGAGAAVAHALLGLGVTQLSIHDLDQSRARNLVEALSNSIGSGRVGVIDDPENAMSMADGLVHATPTGMVHHPGLPLRADLLRASQWVAEVVYFPLETELLRLARRIGCRTMSGRGMAIHQAARSFRLFTGICADAAAMRRDFDALAGC